MKRLLSRFQVAPGQHRPRRTRNGLIFLAILAFLVYAGYSRQIPLLPKGGTEISAAFADANNVRAGTAVRIRGVDVGEVESVSVGGEADDRFALVRMRIDEEEHAQSLRADAGATIYWRTLLGRNMYVELDPGTAEERLGSRMIAQRNTDTQVEVDQALEPLDRTGRKSFQSFLAFLDSGFGDPWAARRTIQTLAPAVRPLTPALRALRGQRLGDLTEAIRGSRDLMAELDLDEARLGSLIDSAAVAVGVTAARRADLASTLQIAPGALDATRIQMARLRGTLDRLDPLASALRPGVRRLAPTARSLRPALDALRPALDDARPLLEDLSPALVKLRSAATAGEPLVVNLQPTVDRLNREIIPFLRSVDDDTKRPVYQLIGPTFAGLDSIAQNFDVNGHDVAFQAGGGARFIDGFVPCTAFLTDPSADEQIRCDGFLEGLNELMPSTTTSAAARSDDGAATAPPTSAAADHSESERAVPGEPTSYWDTAESLLEEAR